MITKNNSVQILRYLLKDDGVFPNSILPLLIYQHALNGASAKDPAEMEKIFESNDWYNSWRNGIYHEHHYHSVTHEVLGVYSGSCDVLFGGERGVLLTVNPGDIIIVPAGVAHKNSGCTENFKCVGAYPSGKSFDMNYGKPGERHETDKNIRKVPPPKADPLYGTEGDLFKYWKA
jgi:uncharacterized protein YjlB